MLELFFIGVGSSNPKPEWGMPGIVIRRKGEIFVFDCGEGFQVEYIRQGLPINRPMRIFITHFHGDHYFGLLPFLHTLALQGRKLPLSIYGPKGLKEYFSTYIQEKNSRNGYEIQLFEIGEGVIIETGEYVIESLEALHSTESLSYFIREKPLPGRFLVEKANILGIPEGPLRKQLQQGRTINLGGRIITPNEVLGPPRRGLSLFYSGDTAYNPAIVSKVGKPVDIVIHESTFSTKEREEAIISHHSTAEDAALIASQIRANILFLTHFSTRYSDLNLLLKEARNVFRRSYLAKKGLKIMFRKTYEPLESFEVYFTDPQEEI